MHNEETHAVVGKKIDVKFLRYVLALAIVIILNLFFAVAVRLAYKEPAFENFCVQDRIKVALETKEACEAKDIGGKWNYNNTGYKEPMPVTVPVESLKQQTGYCDINYTCQKSFEAATSLYNRNVFVVLVVLGIISLIVGYVFSASSAVSLGLSLGGVISLIIASIRYWSDMQEYLRLIILGIALVALVWFGIKKFKD